jgi:hypothetical protein
LTRQPQSEYYETQEIFSNRKRCFENAEINVENEKKALIKEKFEAFKKWAKNEIESI